MIFIMIRLCACFFMYLNTKLICPILKQLSNSQKSIAKEISITKVSSILFFDKPFQFLAFWGKKKCF